MATAAEKAIAKKQADELARIARARRVKAAEAAARQVAGAQKVLDRNRPR